MPCAICSQTNQCANSTTNDCIIEFLDKIKIHYTDLKTQLDDKQRKIDQLHTRNTELYGLIEKIRSPKRRKTSSFEDSSPSICEKSVTADNLNDAIKAEPSWDEESFFVATQQRTATPNNILKASNLPPEPNRHFVTPPSANASVQPSPVVGLLPRRLRGISKVNRQLDIKKTSPTNSAQPSTQWMSKENMKVGEGRPSLVKREWNMSFMQPRVTQQKKVVNSILGASPKENKNVSLSKKEVNLKQTRLKFESSILVGDKDEIIVPETDETFCGELIAASPTSLLSTNSDLLKTKNRSIKKLSRPRFPQTSNETTKKNQTSQLDVKLEPQSVVKKAINFDTKPSNSKPAELTKPFSSISKNSPIKEQSENSLSGIERHTDSSVCILPSQSNDVIIVEESDIGLNIDSAALLDEMMVKSDTTSDFLKKLEEKCISNTKNQQSKQNENLSGESSSDNILKLKLSSTSQPKEKKPTLPKLTLNVKRTTPENDETSATTKTEGHFNQPTIVPKWNCKECESYYTVAGRSLSDQEIQKRMKNCADKHQPNLSGTPAGFWNPCFSPSLENDPRFQTQIDTFPIVQKKGAHK